MRGHGGGHKHHESSHTKEMDKQILHLLDENAKLRKEVNDLSGMVRKES
jgi:hypothetical protein